MSNIKDIVDVSINIKEPTSNPVSYSGMLLLASVPTSVGTPRAVYEISEAAVLLSDYGYESDDPLYIAADVAFRQSPSPDRVFIKEFEKNNNVIDIAATMNAALSNSQWYGFVSAETLTNQQITAAADWAETNRRLFGFSWPAGNIPVSITDYDHTFAIFSGNASEEAVYNPYIHVALMAKCFGYDNGSETWAFKNLKKIQPSALTESEVTTLRTANANFYQTYADKDLTMDGVTGSGEWIDIIRFVDWLHGRLLQRAVEFFAANPKVPFTDAGITGVHNFVTSVLEEGQNFGGIAPTQYDADGEEVPGFTVTVPLARSVSEADRAARMLRNVKFTANLAGAIHKVKITGELVY